MIKAESGTNLMVRLKDGERLPDALLELDNRAAAIVAGIGMLRDVVMGYWDGQRYVEEPVDVPVELLSCQGNMAELDGKAVLHAHVVVGHKDMSTMGGHLIRATVQNTAELVLVALPGVRMERKLEATGLPGLYPTQGPGM